MLTFTKHPILDAKAPTDEEIIALATGSKEDKEILKQWHKQHEARIRLAEEDPVAYGFPLPQQEVVEGKLSEKGIDEVWVLGGNRSGKSFSAARMVMKALIENPNTQIVCWAQNEDASVERQQPYLWQMLPQKYKTKIKGEVEKINYSKATGFAGKKFILPNGSVCYFKYYSQFQNDDSMIEGAMLGCPERDCKYINIGTWCDEYLGDDTLLGRLRSRCGDFNAKILVTFTPMRGYTPTVGKMLDGAAILRSRKAKHPVIEGQDMPLVMQPEDQPEKSVIFYHSDMNPFSNWKRLFRNNANEKPEVVKKVLYGYPTKSMTAMFNTFSHESHVYSSSERKYDFSDKSKWTTYQVIDPAGTKSWCSIHASVNAEGDIRVWAEFPKRSIYGEWAVEGKSSVRSDDAVQWKKGPAAENCGGLSYRSLITEWTKIEAGVPIFERIIDIRIAHNPHQSEHDGKVTIQDELSDLGFYTVPSLGTEEGSGLPLIQEALALPNPNEPFDYNTNRPRLMFDEEVGNMIFSMMNYVKNGAKSEALKDFIDVLRYLMTANGGEGPMHFGPNSLKQKAQGGAY